MQAFFAMLRETNCTHVQLQMKGNVFLREFYAKHHFKALTYTEDRVEKQVMAKGYEVMHLKLG
tara:strand:- start:1518 stop:1706 length:189 start_codon:yes stop_codon:yes gene_type:complete